MCAQRKKLHGWQDYSRVDIVAIENVVTQIIIWSLQ